MATYDTALDPLINPGKASTYFDTSVFTKGLSALDPKAQAFSAVNAWWLMEISRLIYNTESNIRKAQLKKANLDEVSFDDPLKTQFAILSPLDKSQKYAVVVFRGTHDTVDVVTDIEVALDSWDGKGRVHKGFWDALQPVWKDLSRQLMELGRETTVVFTGHSLGAALATLAGALWAAEGTTPPLVYTFGSPRVGDPEFAGSLDRGVYRVVDGKDGVTDVPDLGYQHTGELRPVPSGYPSGTLFSKLVALSKLLVGKWRSFLKDLKRGSVLPQILTDHTPINYVADLERLLRESLP